MSACGGGVSSTASPAPTPEPLTAHVDARAGFSIAYPAAWHTYAARDPGIQLVVGPDERTTVYVRIVGLAAPVDPTARKMMVDQLLGSVRILDETPVAVVGMSGWQVAYAVAGKPGDPAIHVHVFLFEGTRLHTVVFETPHSSLTAFAPLLDRIRDSYQAVPPKPAPAGTSAPGGPGAAPAPAARPRIAIRP